MFTRVGKDINFTTGGHGTGKKSVLNGIVLTENTFSSLFIGCIVLVALVNLPFHIYFHAYSLGN